MAATADPPGVDVRSARHPRYVPLIVSICAAIVVVVLGIAVVAVARDDGRTTVPMRADAPMSQAWQDRPGSGPFGSMMWGDASAMYDRCVQAMGSYHAPVEDPTTWCRTMADWMDDHMGGGQWGGGMMRSR